MSTSTETSIEKNRIFETTVEWDTAEGRMTDVVGEEYGKFLRAVDSLLKANLQFESTRYGMERVLTMARDYLNEIWSSICLGRLAGFQPRIVGEGIEWIVTQAIIDVVFDFIHRAPRNRVEDFFGSMEHETIEKWLCTLWAMNGRGRTIQVHLHTQGAVLEEMLASFLADTLDPTFRAHRATGGGVCGQASLVGFFDNRVTVKYDLSSLGRRGVKDVIVEYRPVAWRDASPTTLDEANESIATSRGIACEQAVFDGFHITATTHAVEAWTSRCLKVPTNVGKRWMEAVRFYASRGYDVNIPRSYRVDGEVLVAYEAMPGLSSAFAELMLLPTFLEEDVECGIFSASNPGTFSELNQDVFSTDRAVIEWVREKVSKPVSTPSGHRLQVRSVADPDAKGRRYEERLFRAPFTPSAVSRFGIDNPAYLLIPRIDILDRMVEMGCVFDPVFASAGHNVVDRYRCFIASLFDQSNPMDTGIHRLLCHLSDGPLNHSIFIRPPSGVLYDFASRTVPPSEEPGYRRIRLLLSPSRVVDERPHTITAATWFHS